MKTDDLLILLELARCGSFLRAGQALGLDHSTVSRRVTALERDMRAPLVDRGVQGCTLTALGQRLLASAELVEQAAAEAMRLRGGQSETGDLQGLVRIATTEAFGSYIVAPALARIHRDHPGLQVEIVTQTRLNPYGIGADIELGVGEPVVGRPNAQPLTQYRLGLYASEEYLRDRPEPRSVDELREHSLVYYVEGLLRVEDLDVLGNFNLGTHAAFGSTSPHAQMRATLAGAGLGLLPSFMAEREPRLRRVLFNEFSVIAEFTACLAADRLRRPAAAYVMRGIQREVARHASVLLPS